MSLSQLDNLYKTTVSKLPNEQRLWYCTRHLDKLEQMLINNSRKLTSIQKKHMEKMIKALKVEIEILENSKD
jgi:hypothetical protein